MKKTIIIALTILVMGVAATSCTKDNSVKPAKDDNGGIKADPTLGSGDGTPP